MVIDEKHAIPSDAIHVGAGPPLGYAHESSKHSEISGELPNRQSDLSDINVSGHVQEVERNYSLLSICALGLTAGNTWAALGGSITVAIYNGGPPFVIYEFITVSVFYWFIAASIAELASALPSAAGVYHWASITPGKCWGRPIGFLAGYWNFFAWIFGTASNSFIIAQITVQLYSIYHVDFSPQRWQVFISFLIVTWLACFTVAFANKALPAINIVGLFFILAGVFITIIVCAVMPGTNGSGHASNSFVWEEFINGTGWTSNGLIYCMGMLNGAFAVGTPDCVTHVAEEIPRPNINIPLAIAAQVSIGFFSALFYLIALFYAISDLDKILTTSDLFPLAAIYGQATGSRGGELGLLILILIPVFIGTIGTYIISSRTLWAIARDNATPFSSTISCIHPTMKNPFNSILICGGFCTVLACIYIGSSTAFSAFIGSFVILTTLSYTAAILPYIITRRKHVVPGPFFIPGVWGYLVNGVAVAYMIVFMIIYCFPFLQPVTAVNMNYASVISGSLTIFVVVWWFVKGSRNYVGPIIGREKDVVGLVS
ncbi:MAG: hypothetical protein M1827_005168 [Pycnora praestabilis]|nr:MAG: hypothetical protein M1827_005168 [Pycnora praestabilis]